MGAMKSLLWDIIEKCKTYEQAVNTCEERGLGTDDETLRGMWKSIKGAAPKRRVK